MRPAYKEFIDTFHFPALYFLVGTEVFASIEEVKKTYRRTAKTAHPDVVCVEKKYEKFIGDFMIAVNAAYDILSNPQKKAEYDTFLQSEECLNMFGMHYKELMWGRGDREIEIRIAAELWYVMRTLFPADLHRQNKIKTETTSPKDNPHADHAREKPENKYGFENKYRPSAEDTDIYAPSSCHPGSSVLFEFIDTCLAPFKRYFLLYILVGGLVFSTVFVWIPKAFFYLTTTPAERAAIAKVETIKKELSVKEAKIRRMERELRLREALRRSNAP